MVPQLKDLERSSAMMMIFDAKCREQELLLGGTYVSLAQATNLNHQWGRQARPIGFGKCASMCIVKVVMGRRTRPRDMGTKDAVVCFKASSCHLIHSHNGISYVSYPRLGFSRRRNLLRRKLCGVEPSNTSASIENHCVMRGKYHNHVLLRYRIYASCSTLSLLAIIYSKVKVYVKQGAMTLWPR